MLRPAPKKPRAHSPLPPAMCKNYWVPLLCFLSTFILLPFPLSQLHSICPHQHKLSACL